MRKILLSTILLLSLLITGCKKDLYVVNRDKGSLSFNITPEGDFSPISKAEAGVNVADFSITLANSAGAVVKAWSKYSEVPSVYTVDPGSYSISAASPGTSPAAFDQPLYSGTQNFVIQAGNVSKIDVTCTLQNMKVTINCTPEFFAELNPDFTITVSTDYGFLIYNKEIISAGRSGYFKPGTMTVYIQGTRSFDNSEVNHQVVISDCQARDHHVLTINARETGEINFGEGFITIDDSVVNRETDIVVDGFNEDPLDPDDPDNPDNPEDPGTGGGGGTPVELITITAPGTTTPLTLTDTQADSAVVDITVNSTNPIAELWVNIDSEYLEGILNDISVPASFDLANLTSATEAFVTGLGLLANGAVSGKTSYSFSIGSFMPLIVSDLPTAQQTHIFGIKVKDSLGNEKTTNITIVRIP